MVQFMLLLGFSLLFASSYTARYEVVPDSGRLAISNAIYGTNQLLKNSENWGAVRQGGNRLTGYNWENNASHAGTDYYNNNDDYLTWAMGLPSTTTAIVYTAFLDSCRIRNRYPLITLPMAGFVARDKLQSVDSLSTAPSSRFCVIKNTKPTALSLTPSLTDSIVYTDEAINYIVNSKGAASSTSPRGYALDNEPALWPSTHPRIHPAATGCQELISKSIDLAGTIRRMDSQGTIFGPVLYGFNAYTTFQDAPDWQSVKSNYGWFVDYYLDKMKKASDSANVRLLDVFDVHWYSEAKGNGVRIVQAANPADSVNAVARMNAPRSLWDSTYTEDSWIGQWFSPVALIPHLKASIDRYFPGTGLAITEFNYGGENHISGGIALVEALGIFGKYGLSFASYWQMETKTAYTSAAYQLYRNCDGNNGSFGKVNVRTRGGDKNFNALYAATAESSGTALHLVLTNRRFHDSLRVTVRTKGQRYSSGVCWLLDGTDTLIRSAIIPMGLPGDSIELRLPPMSALHAVLQPVNTSAQTDRRITPSLMVTWSKNQMQYIVPENRVATLTVRDVLGRTVFKTKALSGVGTMTWEPVSSGWYFVSLNDANEQAHCKMFFVR